MQAKVSKVTTWLDTFFTICLIFQTVTFLITVVAGRSLGNREAKRQTQLQAKELEERRGLSSSSSISKSSRGFTMDNIKGALGTSTRLLMLGHWNSFNYMQDIIGKHEDDPQDRFGTRVVMPVFLLTMAAINFIPSTGASSVMEHPGAGVHSILFKTNATLLCLWLLVFITVKG